MTFDKGRAQRDRSNRRCQPCFVAGTTNRAIEFVGQGLDHPQIELVLLLMEVEFQQFALLYSNVIRKFPSPEPEEYLVTVHVICGFNSRGGFVLFSFASIDSFRNVKKFWSCFLQVTIAVHILSL